MAMKRTTKVMMIGRHSLFLLVVLGIVDGFRTTTPTRGSFSTTQPPFTPQQQRLLPFQSIHVGGYTVQASNRPSPRRIRMALAATSSSSSSDTTRTTTVNPLTAPRDVEALQTWATEVAGIQWNEAGNFVLTAQDSDQITGHVDVSVVTTERGWRNSEDDDNNENWLDE